MSLSLALAMVLQAQPLPTKTDIPPTFSTVICPDEGTVRRMLSNFYEVKPAPNNYMENIDLFFAGLRDTGCIQNGPLAETEITIKSVIDRRTLKLADGPSVIVAYRGTNGRGDAVIGIVNETDNNKFPRTPFDEFTQRWAPEGYFDASQGNSSWPIYRCANFDAAQSAVSAIPERGSKKAKDRAFANARARQKCTLLFSGKFTIQSVGTANAIDCGFECAAIWTPVEVKDLNNGRIYGLIFDTSEI